MPADAIAAVAMTTTIVDPATPYDVAIIGGGAAGVLVAIHLLHRGGGAPRRIAIVEPRAALAQGVAYSTPCPEHLLNVVASRMSAFERDPAHFVRFLQTRGGGAAAGGAPNATFARRMDYAAYLQDTLEAAPRRADVCWIRDEAIDLEGGETQIVTLASGQRLHTRSAVLAIGNAARALPLPADAMRGDPAIDDAWDYAAIRRIDADADLCIVGAGLSMVDAVMTLVDNAHRGSIDVLSRHGLMPLPHAAPGTQQGTIDDLLALGMRARLHVLRGRARDAMRAGRPWQWTMDALRHHGQALWAHASASERRRFLRHAARFWDIHRHRIAPDVAARLQALRAAGQLRVHAGSLRSITADAASTRVRFRPRHASEEHDLRVDRIINATGVETALDRMRTPLVAALRARGTLRPGAFGIGFDTDDDGAIVSADAGVAANLLTLGSARIGQLWESIAIPELRVQAERIAARLAHA